MPEPLTIGQVSRETGVPVETIRFYEREGLIEDPPRRASGYRQYPRSAVRRLRFIRRAKELGFSLKEIDELLGLRTDTEDRCAEVRGQVAAKIQDVEERIRDLSRMRSALRELVELCDERRPSGECPILDLLEEGQS